MPGFLRADYAFLARLGRALDFSFDVDHLPEPFPGPALIVTSRQDHICGNQDAYALLEHYPRASFAVLDRAGDIIWVEQEALVTALIRECLNRVEEYARELSTPTAG
jgi:pimeloyl-ACP methyl ester carboxylesterase